MSAPPPTRRQTISLVSLVPLVSVPVLLVLVMVGRLGATAEARVTPRIGFQATVSGWTTWYGSYDLGALGPAWCIDHGLRAPDPAFAYLPATLPDVDPTTAAALSWAVSAHGFGNDPVEAAAVMLVLHDLRHADYPGGRLDVDALTPASLAGFGGHEASVLARARAIKAEARAHAHLRGPFHLSARIDAPASHQPVLVATLTDAAGTAVAGAGVHVDATGAEVDQPPMPGTGADGSVRVRFRATATTGASFTVHAVVPDPTPAAFAASTVRAQRVVRSSWIGLDTTTTWAPPSPPVPTSTTSTTSTTRPPPTTTTTSTTRPSPTTTTRPPPTTTSTTRPSTTTTAAPPPTTSAPAPTPASTPVTTLATLPRTGRSVRALVALGLALVAGGTALVGLGHRSWSDDRRSRR